MPKRKGVQGRRSAFWPLLVGLPHAALVLGWQGLPAVSSQGMMIRSFLIEGDVPVTPVDPRWPRIPPMVLPLSGQVSTGPVWTAPSTRSLHPPSQEATAVKPWRNSKRVPAEALAKAGSFRRVPSKF